MISGSEFLNKPIILGESVGLRRSDSGHIVVSIKPGCTTLELNLAELQELHVWLGSAIARLRYGRKEPA